MFLNLYPEPSKIKRILLLCFSKIKTKFCIVLSIAEQKSPAILLQLQKLKDYFPVNFCFKIFLFDNLI